jgi:branched-chain amino acid transport system substrate-binding protein
MDEGQIPLPGLTDGAQAAVQYINNQLGGIDGRKVELVTCSVDSTPETNQQCGQKFANDPSLDMAMMGITTAGGPYYQALAPTSLPVLGIAPVTPADFVAPTNVVWYTSGGAGTYVALAKIAGIVKAHTVAYLQLDNPGGQAGLTQFKELTKNMGLDIKSVPVSQTATDVLPQVTQADAANADYVVVGVPNCLPVAKALQTLGAKGKVASVGSCFAAATIKSNPSLFEGWYDPSYVRSPLEGTGKNSDMDTFLSNYPKYAKMSSNPVPSNAQDGWSGLLTLRNALQGLPAGQLDNKAAVLAALKSFHGPVVLGPQSLDCSGNNPSYTSVCTLDSVIEQVHDGSLVPQQG